MTTIQQSIEINVPVHVAYGKLRRFEEYPRFMQDIEAVSQPDDTHLHWRANMSDRYVKWNAEITERRPSHPERQAQNAATRAGRAT